MKLWLLRPIEGLKNSPWEPWYDKAFGFVVRAETEAEARRYADEDGGEETERYQQVQRHPWLDAALSTCVELLPEGESGVVIQDFYAA